MKSILFVDDEPNVLQGLQRMLRSMHREWYMAFVGGGEEALELMAQRPFDIIVSDMRMPGMDGAALLARVMERYPQTVRLALSGQSDKESIFRSVGPTHQFLAKPCDAETLKATVSRAFALRELLGSAALKRLVSRLTTLPTLPDIYTQLMHELQQPEASLASVARIIESDVALTAKTLQYVNSAFFGIRQHVSNTTQAVSLLGLEIVRTLVLMVGIFSQADSTRMPPGFSLESFAHHSLGTGAMARTLSKRLRRDEREINDTFTAGVLHDAGKLVLACGCPDAYRHVLSRVHAESITLSSAETDEFGASHSEIGAYLLGLWGFPDPIVEAIAFHSRPSACVSREFSPLTAVHVADAFAHYAEECPTFQVSASIDIEYIRDCGFEGRLEEWRAACCAGRQEDSQ